jgi:hypothetical protein
VHPEGCGSYWGRVGGDFLLVAAFRDDDGFSQAVLGAAAVGVDDVLDESEAAFKCGGAVAEGSLDRVPEADAGVDEGDDTNLQEALAGGAGGSACRGRGAMVVKTMVVKRVAAVARVARRDVRRVMGGAL